MFKQGARPAACYQGGRAAGRARDRLEHMQPRHACREGLPASEDIPHQDGRHDEAQELHGEAQQHVERGQVDQPWQGGGAAQWGKNVRSALVAGGGRSKGVCEQAAGQHKRLGRSRVWQLAGRQRLAAGERGKLQGGSAQAQRRCCRGWRTRGGGGGRMRGAAAGRHSHSAVMMANAAAADHATIAPACDCWGQG